jgi:hypothetical protein
MADATANFPRRDSDAWFPHERIVDPSATAREVVASGGIAPGVVAPNDFAAYGSATLPDVLREMPARLLSMAAWCARQDSSEHRAWGHMYSAHSHWAHTVAAA